jgi:hypothetical protein
MIDSISSQGDPINWFSPHQRTILAEMSYVELQLLVRHCRKYHESQLLEDLKAEIDRLTRELREEREAFLSRQMHDTKLITELADALWGATCDMHGGAPETTSELIQRAREATR